MSTDVHIYTHIHIWISFTLTNQARSSHWILCNASTHQKKSFTNSTRHSISRTQCVVLHVRMSYSPQIEARHNAFTHHFTHQWETLANSTSLLNISNSTSHHNRLNITNPSSFWMHSWYLDEFDDSFVIFRRFWWLTNPRSIRMH